MKDYKLEVHVTPREGILDPQGKAIEHALHALAFDGVEGVRVGRLITLHLHAKNEADARGRAEEMCRKLLANPVTEDFSVDLVEA